MKKLSIIFSLCSVFLLGGCGINQFLAGGTKTYYPGTAQLTQLSATSPYTVKV